MPYALMHTGTGELLSGRQVNGYSLAYYGVLLWEEEPAEEERLAAILRTDRYGPVPNQPRQERHEAEWEQVLELSRWKPALLTEQEAKMANVKLRNDAALRVYFREGKLQAEPAIGNK